jgi:hypothetical protein
MSTQKDNPFLKQLIANISSNASTGRVTNIGWQSSGKVSLREGNMAPKKPKQDNEITKQADEMPADDVGPVGAANPKGNPDLGASADAEAELPPSKDGEPGPVDSETGAEDDLGADLGADLDGDSGADDESDEEDVDQANAEKVKAQAELEKAKAEKDQAEKDIKKNSHVNLISNPGVHFLLGKIVDHAYKTNTIDSLASEMTGKLKIQTPEDFANFSEEIGPFRGIPGVAELLSSMKGMAGKQSDTEEDNSVTEDFNPEDLKTDDLSNCCGAKIDLMGLCADCGEHCDSEDEEDLDIELDEWINRLQ